MPKSKEKYYVVWRGAEPGIYPTWAECERQVKGVQGARYKAFPTMAAAKSAFEAGPPPIVRKTTTGNAGADNGNAGTGNGAVRTGDRVIDAYSKAQTAARAYSPEIIQDAYAVDAACSGNPGMMEYRGVDVRSRIQLFHFGPIWGTNNIGEFLAIVHALALQTQQGTNFPIYSDSRNALLWIRQGKCKTRLERNPRSQQVYNLIERAEAWLKTHHWQHFQILKWHTESWGEIPADFGRK